MLKATLGVRPGVCRGRCRTPVPFEWTRPCRPARSTRSVPIRVKVFTANCTGAVPRPGRWAAKSPGARRELATPSAPTAWAGRADGQGVGLPLEPLPLVTQHARLQARQLAPGNPAEPPGRVDRQLGWVPNSVCPMAASVGRRFWRPWNRAQGSVGVAECGGGAGRLTAPASLVAWTRGAGVDSVQARPWRPAGTLFRPDELISHWSHNRT